MTYHKPEILVHGDAISTIQDCNSKLTGSGDANCSNRQGSGPAYDLDE